LNLAKGIQNSVCTNQKPYGIGFGFLFLLRLRRSMYSDAAKDRKADKRTL
jgi:hypothetical protein